MNKFKITIRQKEILRSIYTVDKYVTIFSIAEKLGISSRTVLRELPDIEKWLKTYGCSIDKKAGIGIKIKGSFENVKSLSLHLEEQKGIKIYNSRERQIIIISELLQNSEPVKIYSFTRLLNVAEGTVRNDLEKVEEWLNKYDLNLIKKPGLGIYLKGQEKTLRKAIVNLIYENINEYELLDLVRGNISIDKNSAKLIEENTSSRVLNLIEKDTIRKLEVLIFELEESLEHRLTDNAYIGLLVHLALAIQRIGKKESISMDNDYLTELKTYPEYSKAVDITNKISKTFNIEIPEAETGYITMHLRGSKEREIYNGYTNNPSEDLEIIEIAKEMINVAEAEAKVFLEQDDFALTGLINHLEPAINRLRMNMDIRNPLLKEIKDFYPQFFKIASKCAGIVEKRTGIRMPDSEIGFIAMHLGAAIERVKKSDNRTYRVAIACATGIGTSRLLAAGIEKEYDNIQVVDVISTLHWQQEKLMEKGIDFIISTIPMENCPIPVIHVNPLLLKIDKEKIGNFVKTLNDRVIHFSLSEVKPNNLKVNLARVMSYMDGILQVLNNFFIEEYKNINSIKELIEIVSSTLAADEEKRTLMESSLQAREEKGSTVLTGFQSILLHCRTSSVTQLYFGIVRIDKGLYFINAEGKNEQIKLAIIMLAPENCDKAYIEVISYISTMLIEDSNFFDELRNGSKEEVYQKLNNILEKFYKIKSS